MAILDPLSFECFSHNEEQTLRFGARLGELCSRGVVTLSGAMGAGKTTFARGFGAGWGAQQPLRSPTYTLVQEHRRVAKTGGLDPLRLYHIDLYRVQNTQDMASLGFDELLDDPHALLLIEWPEKVAGALPSSAVHATLEPMSETRRRLRFNTKTPETWALLLQLRKSLVGA